MIYLRLQERWKGVTRKLTLLKNLINHYYIQQIKGLIKASDTTFFIFIRLWKLVLIDLFR